MPTVDDNKNRNSSSSNNSSSSGSSSSGSSSSNNNGIGDGNTVDNLSIQQCEEFEKQLTDRLLNFQNRKVYITSSCLIFLICTLALLFFK